MVAVGLRPDTGSNLGGAARLGATYARLVPQKSIIAGGLLVAIGIVVTIASDSGSVTSLIPAFIGVVFVALGAAARAKPDLVKHLMHAVAAVALLAVLGSLGSAIGRGSTGWALFAQLATVVIAGGLLMAAIQSFRAVRLAREAEADAG